VQSPVETDPNELSLEQARHSLDTVDRTCLRILFQIQNDEARQINPRSKLVTVEKKKLRILLRTGANRFDELNREPFQI
jgi:hypothetical protein